MAFEGLKRFGIHIVSWKQWCTRDKWSSMAFLLFLWDKMAHEGLKRFDIYIVSWELKRFDIYIVSWEQWCLRDKNEMQFGHSYCLREQWCPRDKIDNHVFGIPIVFMGTMNNGAQGIKLRIMCLAFLLFSWEQWCMRDEIDEQFDVPTVFEVDSCAGGGFRESVGAFTMIPQQVLRTAIMSKLEFLTKTF
ncbi:hypothetical protein ACFE04_012504 [Oxalis oulophora]